MSMGADDGAIFERALDRRTAPRVENSTVLDQVVAELREIDRRTGIDRTLAIGELVLNRFFGGDPTVWRDRRRNKNNSIRRLASRKDCPFCRSALNEALGVYVAVLELPCVRTFGHIYASHVACVLALPLTERQGILEIAEREQLSVRELRQRVVRMRRDRGERRGRPSARGELRALWVLSGALRQSSEAITQLEQPGTLDADGQSEARQLAMEFNQLGRRLMRVGSLRLAEREARSREGRA
jgi:hypothetical protein